MIMLYSGKVGYRDLHANFNSHYKHNYFTVAALPFVCLNLLHHKLVDVHNFCAVLSAIFFHTYSTIFFIIIFIVHCLWGCRCVGVCVCV